MTESNRDVRPLGSRRWLPVAVLALAAVAAAVLFAAQRGGNGKAGGTTVAAAGLPNTSDYHSLLVSANDPNTLLLGTHEGIFRSSDGGRHWSGYRLGGKDAMSLARPGGKGEVWMAGHDVFAQSGDGGDTWRELRPASLPSLDLHGFAVDPRRPASLYAAVAGAGLYRSVDGGATFRRVSAEVGGSVMALAVTQSGTLLAGDMQRGLLASGDGGKTWSAALRAQVAGLAINPSRPQQILAAGPGILRSLDGGTSWKQVARIAAGTGAVTWAPSNARIAYAVGFDRVLYRSSDGGARWQAVA